MPNQAKFTVPPPPTRNTLDGKVLITDPAWLAWLQNVAFPILTSVSDAGFAPELPLQFRGIPDATGDGTAFNLPQFPGPAPSSSEESAFPPATQLMPGVLELGLFAGFGPQQTPLPWVIADTHANRANYPATVYTPGTLFFETDRFAFYRSNGLVWKWAAGTYTATLANIPTLGTDDAGFLFSVSDYQHVLRWSGSAWGWGPGESGSGYFQDFAVAPTGSGWHACDGTSQNYLKADGTTASVTLPNYGTSAYRKSTTATYASGITAAALPTISGTTNSATTGISVSSASASTGTALAGATQAVLTALTSGGGAVSDPGHSHGLGASAPIALPADPIAHHSVITYFRQ